MIKGFLILFCFSLAIGLSSYWFSKEVGLYRKGHLNKWELGWCIFIYVVSLIAYTPWVIIMICGLISV